VPNEIEERVVRSLPAGETFRSAFQPDFTSYRNGQKTYAPDEYRPEVFAGISMPGDGWGRFIGLIGRLLINDVMNTPVDDSADPGLRDEYKESKEVFWGSWESRAGQLLAALYPKSRTGAIPLLVLTSHNLRVVYVQRRRGSFSKLGPATELGWCCPLSEHAWVREHTSTKKCFEFGFNDKSWAVLEFAGVDEEKDLREHFPSILHKNMPMPF
jgi:hypothetical protein